MVRGKVKWFSTEKGYGFIVAENWPTDLFFHGSDYRSTQPIRAWDVVEFDVGSGRNGKAAAKNVTFVSRPKPELPSKPQRPYYGKKTSTKDKSTSAGIGGALIGMLGGLPGLIIGAAIGVAAGSPREITSKCLRCGGTGNVTAIDERFIGFQCESCKAFWKKRNEENLSMDDVDQRR